MLSPRQGTRGVASLKAAPQHCAGVVAGTETPDLAYIAVGTQMEWSP